MFDGTDLSQWEGVSNKKALIQGKDIAMYKKSAGKMAKWTVNNGLLTVNKDAGDIQTKLSFNDFQLHIEWRIP